RLRDRQSFVQLSESDHAPSPWALASSLLAPAIAHSRRRVRRKYGFAAASFAHCNSSAPRGHSCPRVLASLGQFPAPQNWSARSAAVEHPALASRALESGPTLPALTSTAFPCNSPPAHQCECRYGPSVVRR